MLVHCAPPPPFHADEHLTHHPISQKIFYFKSVMLFCNSFFSLTKKCNFIKFNIFGHLAIYAFFLYILWVCIDNSSGMGGGVNMTYDEGNFGGVDIQEGTKNTSHGGGGGSPC